MFYRRALSPSWLLRQQHSAAGLNLTLLSHCRLPNCVVNRANEIVTQGGVVGLAWGGSQSLGTLLLLIDTLCYSMPAPLPMTAGKSGITFIPPSPRAVWLTTGSQRTWSWGKKERHTLQHPWQEAGRDVVTSTQPRPPAQHCLPLGVSPGTWHKRGHQHPIACLLRSRGLQVVPNGALLHSPGFGGFRDTLTWHPASSCSTHTLPFSLHPRG